MTQTAVQVTDLTKTYGDLTAVNELSLSIGTGEIFGLLGPNGAGKTTTIEILEGYRHRTSGSVEVLGADPADAPRAWRAGLGIVLQSSSLTPTATVGQLVRHYARLFPNPRPVADTIEAVGLADKESTQVRRLSGGQARRLDVALGIIGRPKLLFLDEPTTGFDPQARRDFWELISSLRDGGTTIILTTHYLDEAEQLCDRAAVIAHGRLAAYGPLDTLGGPDARVPVVSWTDATGQRHSERTSRPEALVRALGSDEEATDLEVVRPNLEDVYLGLLDTHAQTNARTKTQINAPTDTHNHTLENAR